MNVIRLMLLQLFELVNLLVEQFGCLCLVVGMYLFDDLLVVRCMNLIQAL